MAGARAGARRERVQFKQQSRTDDGQGGFTTAWVDVGPVTYAEVKAVPVRNPELLVAEQLDPRTHYQVTIPNRRDIVADMKIVWISAGNVEFRIRDLADPGAQAIERTLLAELRGPENQ